MVSFKNYSVNSYPIPEQRNDAGWGTDTSSPQYPDSGIPQNVGETDDLKLHEFKIIILSLGFR